MNTNSFFTKYWKQLVAIVVMIVLTLIYFSQQLSGYGLKQHDIAQHRGAANEIVDYRETKGEEVLWTNSMFGGMPAAQISVLYKGNVVNEVLTAYLNVLPSPAGVVLLYMLGFFVLMMCLRVNIWVSLLGSIAFGFSSYEIIILQAGHNTKALAVAFMAPVLGAFILAYQRNIKWGIILSALFMTLQLSVNHLQVTYYLGIVLVLVGIVFFVEALRKKTIKNFAFATLGLLGAYAIGLAINYGNISMTSDYAKHTIRGGNDITLNPDGTSNKTNSTTGLDKDYVTQWSYGIGESFTLISPYVKGGGTIALAESPFAEDVENLDLSSEEMKGVMNYPVYWGEQPITTGPVYIGVIVVFLAFLGMIFIKSPVKWALLAATILTLALSWGKNMMGLTDFFLENVPGYNKFRAVTIILVIVELCIPIIGVLFLDLLVKEREQLKEKKKLFLIGSAVAVFFLLAVKFVGLGDGYASSNDQKQVEGIEANIMNQLAGMDPAVLQSQYNLDINNAQQVQEFVSMQAEPYRKNFDAMKVVRKSIFDSSMNRSIMFVVFTIGLLALMFYTTIQTEFVVLGLLVLVLADLIPVSRNYLGNQEQGEGYKYWELKVNTMYPIPASTADIQILEAESMQNAQVAKAVAEGAKLGKQKADELGLSGTDRRRVEDTYKFRALNRSTNYRVFDMSGGFSSANSSYFHKALGGYHGAKLRSIQNLFDYHLSRSNNKVYDMLNVKYFIQPGEQGMSARPNPTALGNAWFIRTIQEVENADQEIRALGSKFALKNAGVGQLLVNNEVKTEADAFGFESLRYVIPGKDTMDVPLSNGMQEGMEALFVMDVNGTTNLIPKQTMELDTAKSFLKLVEIKLTDEFKPREEAVMQKEIVKKGIKKLTFTGEGTITMKSYAPNRLKYTSQAADKQFAVFSEIYYADGWKAFIDGKEVPIKKVNYLLRGLEVPAGKHQIEFVFDLPKYHLSTTFAYIGSALIFFLLGWGIYSDRKKKVVEA